MMTHPALMLELTKGVTAARIRDAERRATVDTDTGLIDQLMVSCAHREWKEAAADVSVAYFRWSGAGSNERILAFAAYSAALDREAAAASAYADRLASFGDARRCGRSREGDRPQPLKAG
ncbi:MAG: hypothetical protein JO304_01790 [Solirubrobacterales bacterium]|nr:hypothetical protein [Solirubrobacterales bacterium]